MIRRAVRTSWPGLAAATWLLLAAAASAEEAQGPGGLEDPITIENIERDARERRAEQEGEEDKADEAEVDEEDEGLRQRLTEREDKRRPLKPFSVEVFDRRLVVGGEWELGVAGLRRFVLGEPVRQENRVLLGQELEVEAFYSFGPALSIFAQVRGIMEEDLLSHTVDELSDLYVERGEMWLYSENIADLHINFDVGRLNFEDERRWWWDEDLDALRLAYETDTFEIAFALARELGSARSDRDWVEPDHHRVLRWIGELGWDWHENHAIEAFFLHQNDHSPTESPGQSVKRKREDDSDGDLTWGGLRTMGVIDFGAQGYLGYWLDAGLVRGKEKVIEYESVSGGQSEVQEVIHRDVSGWAVDVGLDWLLPFAWEPRLFAGYAFGSGDSNRDSGTDHAFRQTGLEGNESGFGGVERFNNYGVVLQPELSNLHIVTAGWGATLFRSSSIDLVYHHYRLVDRATSLRDSLLEIELDGEARHLGDGIDLVIALEEWERLEFEFIAAGFRAGQAFGSDRGKWSYGGFAAIRFAF